MSPCDGTTDLFPPSTGKLALTLTFLGYTKVRPYKRQFERTLAPGPARLRYLNPGSSFGNLEAPGWFLQYLRSLPTLRLSDGHSAAEFVPRNWLERLQVEPRCAAAGA